MAVGVVDGDGNTARSRWKRRRHETLYFSPSRVLRGEPTSPETDLFAGARSPPSISARARDTERVAVAVAMIVAKARRDPVSGGFDEAPQCSGELDEASKGRRVVDGLGDGGGDLRQKFEGGGLDCHATPEDEDRLRGRQ